MIFHKGVEVIIASRSKFVSDREHHVRHEYYEDLRNPFKKIGTFNRNRGMSLPLSVEWGENGSNAYDYHDLIIVSSKEMKQFETPDQFFCHMRKKMDSLCERFHLPTNEDEFTGEDHFDVYFHFEQQLLGIQEIVRTALGE